MKFLIIAGLCLVVVVMGKPSAQETELNQLRNVLHGLGRLEARNRPRPPPPPGATPPPGGDGSSPPPPPSPSTTAAPSKRQGGEGGDENVRCLKDGIQQLKDAVEALKGCLPPPPTTPAPAPERILLLRAMKDLLMEEMNN